MFEWGVGLFVAVWAGFVALMVAAVAQNIRSWNVRVSVRQGRQRATGQRAIGLRH